MPTPFAALPKEQQIELLLGVAREALAKFGLKASEIESINHEFNSTFRVVADDGNRYALRINVNSERTIENLRAEVTWVRQITEVVTPKPMPTRSGEFFVVISSAAASRDFACVLYSWVDGEELGDEPTEEQLFALGAALAKLHQVPKRDLEPGCSLPVLDDALWHVPDTLLTDEAGLSAEDREVVTQAYQRITDFTKALYASGTPQVIHADLHGWNAMWSDSGITVFDFDDCAIGFPSQDIFTTLYYLDTEEQDAAVLRGYASVAPVPSFSEEDRKLLLIQRRLVLNNILLHSATEEFREMFPKYTAETIRRLREWLS
jgi:Ser/Thr protein kinase RdoA (MazF antagonist)